MNPLANAVQSAPACEKHRARHSCRGVPKSRCMLAGYHAGECDACALAVVNTVLVAAREGGWERAVPVHVLQTVFWHGDVDIRAGEAVGAELHRRAKEEAQ